MLIMNTAANAVPNYVMMLDYLLYYPFVDMSVTDAQPLVNTVTLPRYTSGVGVQIMAVQVILMAF